MAASSLSSNYAVKGEDESFLQKHVSFFDRNHDGIVYPWETFQGFRAIGCGILLSTASAFIINTSFSQKTRPGKFPSLLFPIEIKNINMAKHGSDSGVYDFEGRFVESKFEEIFTKYSRSRSNALTYEEMTSMLTANRDPKDYKGWFNAGLEWKIMFRICKDKNGLLQKDTIRAVLDGSLFSKMEKETASMNKP